jgi:hypothetical protein
MAKIQRAPKAQKEPKRPKDPGAIAPWLRVVLGLASIGSGVIGYFAIMRAATPEVGGVAFVGLAGLFGVLAAFGRVPLKVTAGNFAVEFNEAAKIVEAAEPLPPAERVLFAERLRDHADDNPAFKIASDAILAGADFETLVIAALRAEGWIDDNFVGIPLDSGLDVVIRVGDQRVAVGIKANRDAVRALDAARLQFAAQRFQIEQVLIIVPDSATRTFLVVNGVMVIPVSRIIDIPGLFS